jgi:hypothetical protein
LRNAKIRPIKNPQIPKTADAICIHTAMIHALFFV